MELPYHELMKSCNATMKRRIRLDIVRLARKNGKKATARYFKCSKNTVKRLLREHHQGNKTLEEKSRRPIHSPNVISKYWECIIITETKKIIKKNKRTNAAMLKREYNIPYSEKTIRRVLHENELMKKRKRKYQRARDLRDLKKQYEAFEKIQIDVKYLNDIPEFFREYKQYKLPKFQFTARCIRTGALFFAYGRELTVTNAVIFVTYLMKHLIKYGISVRVIQTDNGTEFIQNWQMKEKSEFTRRVEKFGVKHRQIPPGAKTWQSDVESSHRLIEDEFYAHVSFDSITDFFNKAAIYQKNFNFIRENKYKYNMSPKMILEAISSNTKISSLKLEPIILDKHIDKYYFRVAA